MSKCPSIQERRSGKLDLLLSHLTSPVNAWRLINLGVESCFLLDLPLEDLTCEAFFKVFWPYVHAQLMNTFCFCLFMLTEGVLVLLEDPFEVCDRLFFDTLTVVGIKSSLSELKSELELDRSDPGSGSSHVPGHRCRPERPARPPPRHR